MFLQALLPSFLVINPKDLGFWQAWAILLKFLWRYHGFFLLVKWMMNKTCDTNAPISDQLASLPNGDLIHKSHIHASLTKIFI